MKSQRVLVIGGSSGIGEATALRAASAGATVTIASRSPERLNAALQRLPTDVAALELDVRSASAVESFFNSQAPWDHVILAGSSTQVGTVKALPLDQAHDGTQSKFWGAYHVGRSALICAGGSLTFVSGVYAQRPNVNAVLQGALNAAVEGLMRGLALELAPAGIRVNAVSPSTTETPLWDRLGPEGREAKFETMRQRLPTGRVAAADDIAHAILYVATNPSATGSTVLVDGGDALV
ncbi:SDR family oxidoreductase [Marinobacter sp. ANT_B65]|uniref:SDR family oxidoreductase n=1 Tax=Marinobacter sp. ANT_B65 TaxID=2039467 RepID=UPI000BBEBF63|nr:SDR family oxidoreductase [Marinobacter sp. ANT_B65]PCM44019.1 short chain dehydrogenase [Marinobacter sp. ANT_B65]